MRELQVIFAEMMAEQAEGSERWYALKEILMRFDRASDPSGTPATGRPDGLTVDDFRAAAIACECQANIHDRAESDETGIATIHCQRGKAWHEMALKFAYASSPPDATGTPPDLRRMVADAWYQGRASTELLPVERATGPQLQDLCDRAIQRALTKQPALATVTPDQGSQQGPEFWCVSCDVPIYSLKESQQHTGRGHGMIGLPPNLTARLAASSSRGSRPPERE